MNIDRFISSLRLQESMARDGERKRRIKKPGSARLLGGDVLRLVHHVCDGGGFETGGDKIADFLEDGHEALFFFNRC